MTDFYDCDCDDGDRFFYCGCDDDGDNDQVSRKPHDLMDITNLRTNTWSK